MPFAPWPLLKPAWISGNSISVYNSYLHWMILSIILLACEMKDIYDCFHTLWSLLSLVLVLRQTSSHLLATGLYSRFAGTVWLELRTFLRLLSFLTLAGFLGISSVLTINLLSYIFWGCSSFFFILNNYIDLIPQFLWFPINEFQDFKAILDVFLKRSLSWTLVGLLLLV